MPAESRRPRNPRQNPAATADTLLNVRKQYEHFTDILDAIFTTLALPYSDHWYSDAQWSISCATQRRLPPSDFPLAFWHLLPVDLLSYSDSQNIVKRRHSSSAHQHRIPDSHYLGFALGYFYFPSSSMSRIIQTKLFQRRGVQRRMIYLMPRLPRAAR